MFKVLCDNALMCDSRIEELALINPKIDLEENKAGSFSFKIPPNHPMYDAIQRRKSIVEVYQDDELKFCGICIEVKTNFYKQKSVSCEGEMTFLNDSIQRPAKYQNKTVRGLLETYIANHNAQVDSWKQFQVGIVTVTDPNDSLYCFTNMETTMQCLKADLVDDLGGFFRIRHVDGIRYIDYLADSQNTNSQVIKLGKNLMDFTSNINSTDIATAIIPLGARLEQSEVKGLETRLTIESVNDGKDYVFNQDAVNTYGWIFKKVEYDDVTTASALKSKGEQYLSDIQFENMVIEAKAIDLHLTDKDIESFKISDLIRVVSAPHGLDRFFRLTKMTINLDNPASNTVTLGKSERVSLSAQTSSVSDAVKKAVESIVPSSSILQQAVENATQLITNAMGGYVYKTNNELYIMDTNDPKTAKKVWRWNINGLGYSSTGINGTYGLAMTMDGAIVADFITTGKLKLGGSGIVIESDKFNIDSDGKIDAVDGKFSGTITGSSGEFTKGFKVKIPIGTTTYYLYITNGDISMGVEDSSGDPGACSVSCSPSSGSGTVNIKGVRFLFNNKQVVTEDDNNFVKNADGNIHGLKYGEWTSQGVQYMYVEAEAGTFAIPWSEVSDKTLKMNIEDSSVKALDLINAIRFVQFDWNGKHGKVEGAHENLGVIADEMIELLPDSVIEVEQKDGTSIKHMSNYPLIIHSMKAIQELSGEVESLKDEIKTMKGRS